MISPQTGNPAPVDWGQIRQSALGSANLQSTPPPMIADVVCALRLIFGSQECSSDQVSKLTVLLEANPNWQKEFLRQLNFGLVAVPEWGDGLPSLLEQLEPDTLRMFLASSGIQASQELIKSSLLNNRNFWATNQERALIAWEIAKLLGCNPVTAFVAARVQDFLLPKLCTRFITEYLEYQARPQGVLTTWEHERFGQDHAVLAACALLDWGCPDELICCVLSHHRGGKLFQEQQLTRSSVAAVAIASLFPDPLRQVPDGLEQLLKLQHAWPGFDILDIAERVDQRMTTTERRSLNHISLLRCLTKRINQRPITEETPHDRTTPNSPRSGL